MIKIGLMGFEFISANKGCEALTYSFVNLLNDIIGKEGLSIYVWDTELGKLPNLFPNMHFEYVKPKIRERNFYWIRKIIQCDYIFDVTMGDSFSDIYSRDNCLANVKLKRMVEILNRKYVLMPQTYGPFFDENVKKMSIKVINKSYRIYSRDVLSINYLEKIGVSRNIHNYNDLAFLLPYDSSLFSICSPKKKLGINVSGLLWKGGFTDSNQFGLSIDYCQYIRSVLIYVLDKTEWEVHLIPHVIDEQIDAYDDDVYALKAVKEEFPDVILAPSFENPIEAKSYISNMDCFVGSRMHSTIGSLSAGVPTIPVSYSRKFEGLFNTLNYKYVIHGTEDSTEEAILSTCEYIDRYFEIKDEIKLINEQINEKNELFKKEISKLFKN